MDRVREEELLSQGLVVGHDSYQLHHAPLAVPQTYVFADDCVQEKTGRLLWRLYSVNIDINVPLGLHESS